MPVIRQRVSYGSVPACELWWLHLALRFKNHALEESRLPLEPLTILELLCTSLCTGLSSEVQPRDSTLLNHTGTDLLPFSTGHSSLLGFEAKILKVPCTLFPTAPLSCFSTLQSVLESARPSGSLIWNFHKEHGSASSILQEGHGFNLSVLFGL